MQKKNTNRRKQHLERTTLKVYDCVVDFPEIKRRRLAMGLSQTEAAKLAGWKTQQQWAHLEGGSRPNPRIDTLTAVARVLKCRVPDLLLETNER